MEIIFWISLMILVYVYVGYGVIVSLILRFRKRKALIMVTPDQLPACTHIIAAYNEAPILREKIINTLALNYPEGKQQVIVVTDGSTDNPHLILGDFPEVLHLHQDKREGKLAAVNRSIALAHHDILVFSDANAFLNEEALYNMNRHFSDNAVGAVAGEKVVLSGSKDDAASAGEGIYWKYESWLKKMDSELKSTMGAAGELFAIKKHLYQAPEKGMLIEDFITSMTVVLKGYKIAYEPRAKASEYGSASIGEELKRKIRIGAGGLQAIFQLKSLLNPFKYGIASFQYISHRVLRWTIAPLALVVLATVNAFLLGNPWDGYKLIGAAQGLFYTAAIIGFIFEKQQIRLKILFVPFYFSFMHFSMFISLYKLLTGNYQVVWEKALRK